MRSTKLILGFLALLVLAPVSADAGVRVTFQNPERYRDQDFRRSYKREAILKEFRKHFDRLGARYIKEGQTLTIAVLNIELAGQYEPWRGLYETRVLRDTTPPSITLRYTLTRGKKVLMRGEETITDMGYLRGSSSLGSSERFAYEKDMLRDWFRRRFGRL